MMRHTASVAPDGERNQRLEWVDIAKGICIMLVVLMHSALGVEKVGGQPLNQAGQRSGLRP